MELRFCADRDRLAFELPSIILEAVHAITCSTYSVGDARWGYGLVLPDRATAPWSTNCVCGGCARDDGVGRALANRARYTDAVDTVICRRACRHTLIICREE